MTRNRALLRTSGEFIQVLDADDVLLPGALRVASDALQGDGSLAYALGRLQHLVDGVFADDNDHGRAKSKGVKPPYGVLAPGVVPAYWEENERMPFGPNCAMWRRLILFAYGGWAAQPIGEDTSLFLAVSENHPGRNIDQFTLLYRCHPGSIMHKEGYWDVERPRGRVLTYARLKAIRDVKARGAFMV